LGITLQQFLVKLRLIPLNRKIGDSYNFLIEIRDKCVASSVVALYVRKRNRAHQVVLTNHFKTFMPLPKVFTRLAIATLEAEGEVVLIDRLPVDNCGQ
jgi:hypothetical protein